MSAIQSSDGLPEDLPELELALCPDCMAPLDLCQPDPDLVDRLLGVCVECKDWFELDGMGVIRGKLRLIRLRP